MDVLQDPRWNALRLRDRTADGAFVYSVRTTGVYCRPSCAARMPRPENVGFHPSGAEAERAGFRPCKRCRPDQPATPRHAETVAAVCRRIAACETLPTLAGLARDAGLSPGHLQRVFRSVTGLTPLGYARAQRASRVRAALGAGGSTVTEALYDAGFASSGRFYEAADGMLGMTPSQFRAGGADTEIRFATGQCVLGAILVASTARGVCAILLGDDPQALVRDLQDRFPRARLRDGEAGFAALVERVVGLVQAPGLGLDLPLDLRGTVFQQRVWQALRQIPPGETISYAALAARIGAPGAARAVAGACAANSLAIAIPCHRVVRQDGTLSGYRWGVARKRALLAAESKPGSPWSGS